MTTCSVSTGSSSDSPANLLGRWAPDPERHTVPWGALNISDPERARLKRTLAELRRRAA